jgi:hypothetical protein
VPSFAFTSGRESLRENDRVKTSLFIPKSAVHDFQNIIQTSESSSKFEITILNKSFCLLISLVFKGVYSSNYSNIQ